MKRKTLSIEEDKRCKTVSFSDRNTIITINYDLDEELSKREASLMINSNLVYKYILKGKYQKALKFLKENSSIDLDKTFDNDSTILHLAFSSTQNSNSESLIELIMYLISKGASLDVLDDSGTYSISYSNLVVLEELFRGSLNFDDLSDAASHQSFLMLDSLAIHWNFDSISEIFSFIEHANEFNFRIKIFPKTNESFFEAISFLLWYQLGTEINSSNLRTRVIEEIIIDQVSLGLTEESINQMRDINFTANKLMIRYTSKIYSVIIELIHELDNGYERINFYEDSSEIDLTLELSLFEEQGYYFPIIEIFKEEDPYTPETSISPPSEASEFDYIPASIQSNSTFNSSFLQMSVEENNRSSPITAAIIGKSDTQISGVFNS